MRVRSTSSRVIASAVIAFSAATVACAPALHHRSAKAPVDSVSVGYGQQDPRNVTSSVSSVTPDEHTYSAPVSLEQLIEGRVAGVEILRDGSGRVSLRIRGTNSLTSSTEPLYVIDGVTVQAESFSDAMSGVNPRDVARIDILKDAAATAIYGAQGANGVVLVTTKRAK
jgi:TonB-dependent SusC/RagA subfamily outer membrane receptor